MSRSTSGPPIVAPYPWGFDAAFARLQVAVLEAGGRGGEWPARVAAAVRAGLALAAADPSLARALTVEALAAGAPGVLRQRRAIAALAESLAETVPADERRPPLTEELVVGALVSVVTERVYAGETATLPQLSSDLVELILMHYVDAEDAARLARAAS